MSAVIVTGRVYSNERNVTLPVTLRQRALGRRVRRRLPGGDQIRVELRRARRRQRQAELARRDRPRARRRARSRAAGRCRVRRSVPAPMRAEPRLMRTSSLSTSIASSQVA